MSSLAVTEEQGLHCIETGTVYPVVDGLIFGGYDAGEETRIADTMEEERDWQGTVTE